jgi:hypothetical protein
LILVTAVACWLGWESSVVRRRAGVLKAFQLRPGVSIMTADDYKSITNYVSPPGKQPASVPFIRRLLGDRAVQQVEITLNHHNLSSAELALLKRTFPEAEFRETEVLAIPCHPGCFPRGTLVETPAGQRPIELIAQGDVVTAFLPSGEQITASVESIFVTDNRLWRVVTEDGELLTTETQPLCLAADHCVPAGELAPGDEILRWDGGAVHPVKVLSVTPTDRIEQVINLVLGDNQLFIAGGFLARSKPPRDS